MRYIICAVLLILPLHVKAQEQSTDVSSDALSHIENDEHANIWGAQDLKNALTRWLGDHDVRVDERTSIGPLDERIRLEACTSLDIAPHSARSSSYVLHCLEPQSWNYVLSVTQDGRGVTMKHGKTASAQGMQNHSWTVVVPRVSLPSGSTLAPQDLEERSTDVYPGSGSLKTIAEATGLRLTGAVSAGTVLTTYNVAKAPLVMKGETITLVATGSGFDISTPGTAEEDGYKGDLITVRNLKTGTILKGRVAEGKIIAVASFL